jgi:hypothetical protein
MKGKSIPFLLFFIFICVTAIVVLSSREINRLNDAIDNYVATKDSINTELEIERFEKDRYISIIEQLSTSECEDVKRIIHGK